MREMLLAAGEWVATDAAHRNPGWRGEPLFGFVPMPMVWNFVAVLLVALIFWWLIRSSQKGGETPLDLLNRRYVSGEIDRKTYLQMKEDISG